MKNLAAFFTYAEQARENFASPKANVTWFPLEATPQEIAHRPFSLPSAWNCSHPEGRECYQCK